MAYYPFNGNANDESGNNRNGQVPVGGPTLTLNRFGQPNSAYMFSGVNGGITVPDSLHPIGSNPDLTSVFWIKAPYSDVLRVAVGVSSYTTGSGSGCGITLNGTLLYSVHNGENYFTNSPYQPQTWNQVAYSKEGRTVTIYLNGAKVGSALAASTFVASKNLYIGWNGNYNLGSGQQWVGAIDDLRIYNRTLSDSDIKAIYNYESTPPDNSFTTNGLVAYYPFNGNANDESGNGKNGIVTGALLAPDRFNSVGSSYYFDGNDYIELPDRRFLENESNITISAWYCFNGNQEGQILAAGDYREGNDPISMRLNPTEIRALSLDDTIGKKWFPAPNVPLKYTNQGWHHFVFILSSVGSSSMLRVFQDGEILVTTNRSSGFRVTYDRDMATLIGAIEGRPFYSSPSQFWKGWLDDLRMYNRSLSDVEVKELYNYECQPQPSNPRIATATLQVVNGFVVGATIASGGNGYTNNPLVTITGGGGSGAKATAVQVNGVVTSITITNPGSGYTSTPTITIAPPPFPPKKAAATSQVVNGFVVGTTITDAGFGYDVPPSVLLVGGGGTGATAAATVQNGVVTAITITNPGTGYTSAPLIRIASPPFTPKLAIEVSKVNVRLSVVLGRKYQIESSSDLTNWKPASAVFVAQDEELIQEFDVNTTGSYYRINQVP